MPELPDLVRVERVLGSALTGRRVTAARIGDPTVLRVMVPDPVPAVLVGRVMTAVERRGHFMRFGFGQELALVVNAMLVGRYRLLAPDAATREKDPVALGFALTFDDGGELRYVDDKRMGKVYVVRAADERSIPVYGQLGVDLLSPAFDRAHFLGLAHRRRDQARMFLMDKSALASIGNAYADEILFAAGIHPKTFVRQLNEQELNRLYDAVGQVLRHAIDEIERRGQPVDVKVRDFLAVRGRDGKPCPRCGTTLRAVRVGDGDACFCPTCQPTTRRLFVDWSSLSGAAGQRAGPQSTGAATPLAERTASAPALTDRSGAVPPPPPAAGGTAPRRRRSPRSGSRRRAPSES